ncbi:DUF4169 family protein [Nisaea sediminum]|uniref:DUF4169 family protein n=1 Tax=Nisaea sediminum TaxID=2775867 RepID=UPI001866F8C7|nr:DUF4169 family protein [Nisaea sediminum]
MSGKIVNLRQARKRKARETDARKAEENRTKFGRTRAERAEDNAGTARREQQAERLEGHRMEKETPSGES